MGTLHENAVYNSIKYLCDNHTPRVSFSKMCTDLGISKSLGTKLKDNPDRGINMETAQMIADYFGVSVDRVIGNEKDTKKAPTPEGERNYTDLVLIDAFHNADESTKAAIRLLLKL